MYRNLVLCSPHIEELVIRKTNWFRKNPNDSRLRNHRLTKRMNGRHAFSITDDIRIVYKWVGKKSVRFLSIGTHKEVYGKHKRSD